MNDFGGRTRVEVEYDVLASMVLIVPFRRRSLVRLTRGTFTTSEHQRLFSALRNAKGEPADDPEMFVSRVLGVDLDAATDWLLNALPTDYDADLERLLCRTT